MERRYAQGLFELAREEKKLNKWLRDLKVLNGLVKDESLRAILVDMDDCPDDPLEDKMKKLAGRAGDVDERLLKLVLMLADERKLDLLDQIVDEYQERLDRYHGVEGVEVVDVTTAIPLEAEETEKITERLEKALGKPVMVKASVDPDIIGGIVIRIGDRLIDGSLRHQLDVLKKEMV